MHKIHKQKSSGIGRVNMNSNTLNTSMRNGGGNGNQHNPYYDGKSGFIREHDDDEDFFNLEDQDQNHKMYMEPTAVNSIGNNSVNQSLLDETIISQTMKHLADKAYELSVKHDLRDEAKLIQQEEIRLRKLLKEEEDQRNQIASRLNEEETRLKTAFREPNKKSRQGQINQSKTISSGGAGNINKVSNGTINNKSLASQRGIKERQNDSLGYPLNSIMMSSVQNTNMNINTIFNEDSQDDLNESEVILNQAVQRLFDDATRRKELKERIQLLSAKRELEELRQQPEINKKSYKMAKDYIPIHERYEKVIHDQSIKKNQFTAEILEESIQKDPDQFFPSFHPRTNPGPKHRNFDEFINNQQKWQQDKQKKLEDNQMQHLGDIEQKCTFKPQINDVTVDIISQSEKYRKTDVFLQRVEKYQEIKELKIKHIEYQTTKDLTFKPETYSKLETASKYYERQIKKQQQILAQQVQQEQSKQVSQKSSSKQIGAQNNNSEHNSQKAMNTINHSSINQSNNNHDKSMTPTFNMSVNDSMKIDRGVIEQSFSRELEDQDLNPLQYKNKRQAKPEGVQQYKSLDKLTQITNTNEKGNVHHSVNDDSFSRPGNTWIFSSDQNLTHPSEEDSQYGFNEQVSPFSVNSNKSKHHPPEIRKHYESQKTANVQSKPQQNVQPKNRIDLQNYLAQLEIKMKMDEEELQFYERELSKHSSSQYENY